MKRIQIMRSPVMYHCDVPCGIYKIEPARTAAETIVRMIELIEELPKDNPTANDRNKFVRCVLTKEKHAKKCKKELLILWTDYFKPEHLTKFPDLHDIFWKAAKLCSKNKQEINMDAAKELLRTVDKIGEIFTKTKTSK